MAENTITFKVLGMTCTMCALTIEKQLSDQEGVTSANVNFALGHATVTYVPKEIAPKQLVQAIRDVGYDVDIERAELEIAGIVCVACVNTIENALKEVPGVIDESINPVTAQGVVDYDPSVVSLEKIIQTIRSTGYDVIEAPPFGAESELVDREKAFREREIAQYRNQFIFTVIFGIPLLLGILAHYIPIIPAFFAAPVFQFAVTVPVMIIIGYGFYRRALISIMHRGANMDVLI
ncbi:MAG: copper ion binding protein, partial [Halobacteriota archaeon]